jgi:hypothetical protein
MGRNAYFLVGRLTARKGSMYFICRISKNYKFWDFKKKDKKSLTAADKLQTPAVVSTSFYFWLVLAACGWSLWLSNLSPQAI